MFKKIHPTIASAKFCFIRSLEFRNEVIVWSISSIAWAFIALFGISIIFGQVDTIAGWSRQEVTILVVTQELFISLMWMSIIPSLLNLSEVIRTGNFDFYLLRPISARFFGGISRFEFDQYPRVAVLIIIMSQLLGSFGFRPSVFSIFCYVASLILGVGIFYSLFFTITTTAFWFTRIFNLEDFFDNIMSAGRFPTFIYGGSLRFIYFYIIPVFFIATFPVQILLGKVGIELVVVGFAVFIIFYVFSQKFWDFALKRYSSASS